MRILVWHVHGAWMESFVRGGHDYLVPVNAAGDEWGRGRSNREWPANVIERSAADLAGEDLDVVVLQRPGEIEECVRLTGRRPGRDLPAVYLEHNTPAGPAAETLHPLSRQSAIPIVHVTHFNQLFWDNGRAGSIVIEHGIVDPGPRYRGDLRRQAIVINEPVRRWRITGTDLLPAFAQEGPIEAFGIDVSALPDAIGLDESRLILGGDLPTSQLHDRLAECRLYLHPFRWTSLGLALLEAMHLAMPVVVLDATEAARAVPPEAGAISSDVAELARTARLLLDDPDEAAKRGRIARQAALARYGLTRFLQDWDVLLDDTVAARPRLTARKGQPR